MGKLRIISETGEPFSDRLEAGRMLAGELRGISGEKPVVLGIPRGGVIVANEIATELVAEFDIVLSHKLGAPANPELAIGAVCEDGSVFVDSRIASYVGADEQYIDKQRQLQLDALTHRAQMYRQIRPKLSLANRLVIVTDDGVATGATMQAALWAIKQEKPQRIIAALPVGPLEIMTKLSAAADETICLRVPPFFEALSRFYLSFEQVDDRQLLDILRQQTRTKAKT